MQSVPAEGMLAHEGLVLCAACVARARDLAAKGPPARRESTPATPQSIGASAEAPPSTGGRKPSKWAAEGGFWTEFLTDARHWCRGRSWWIRTPLILYFAYAAMRYLIQPLHPAPHDSYMCWFDAINLGFHELGHYVFRPFGRFMTIFGGTLLQCLIPVIAGIMLWRKQRDYFGVAFSLAWLSTNFFNVGIYVADARTRQLPLVAPGVGFTVDKDMHDWYNLLTMTGLLKQDENIAVLLKIVGAATMATACWFGIWLCWQMWKMRDATPYAQH